MEKNDSDERLVDLVSQESQIFTTVESSEFKKLVKALNPYYVPPTRHEACFLFHPCLPY